MKRTLFAVLAAMLAAALLLSGCGLGGVLWRFTGNDRSVRAEELFTPAPEEAQEAREAGEAQEAQEAREETLSRREMAERVIGRLRELCSDTVYLSAMNSDPEVLHLLTSWSEAEPQLDGYAWKLDPAAAAEYYLREIENADLLSEAGRDALLSRAGSFVWSSLCAMVGTQTLAAASMSTCGETFPDPGCEPGSTAWILPTDDPGVHIWLIVSASEYGSVTMTASYLRMDGSPDEVMREMMDPQAVEAFRLERCPFEL